MQLIMYLYHLCAADAACWHPGPQLLRMQWPCCTAGLFAIPPQSSVHKAASNVRQACLPREGFSARHASPCAVPRKLALRVAALSDEAVLAAEDSEVSVHSKPHLTRCLRSWPCTRQPRTLRRLRLLKTLRRLQQCSRTAKQLRRTS